MNICSSFVHNSQNLETTQMSFSVWVIKYSVVHLAAQNTMQPSTGIHMDTGNILDASQGKYAA